jgi:hypothetical protein
MPDTYSCPHCRAGGLRLSPVGEFVSPMGNQPDFRVRVVRLTCAACGYTEERVVDWNRQPEPEPQLTPIAPRTRGG